MPQISERDLALLKLKARAHDDYLKATKWMSTYIQVCRRQLQEEDDPVFAARLRGRIEAIVEFDKQVVAAASERVHR